MDLIVNFPEARVRGSNNQNLQYVPNSDLQFLLDFALETRQDVLKSEPNSPPPAARKPQVSFSAESEIKFVKKLGDDFKSALWFTEPEMKSFRRNALMQVRAIKSRLKSPSDVTKMRIKMLNFLWASRSI